MTPLEEALLNPVKETEDQFGKPDYTSYPVVGYSYSAMAKIVENRLLNGVEALSFEIAALLPVLEDSPLDRGYYLFAVLKNGVPVYIGTGEGKGNKRPIAAARKKYGAGAVVLLAYALNKRQAATMKQTLERRLGL